MPHTAYFYLFVYFFKLTCTYLLDFNFMKNCHTCILYICNVCQHNPDWMLVTNLDYPILNLISHILQYPVRTNILILENRNPIRGSRPEVFLKMLFVRFFAKFTRKHQTRSLILKLQAVSLQLYQKETTKSLFSCGLYELFYSIFFAKYICVITSTQSIYDLNWTYVRISNVKDMKS